MQVLLPPGWVQPKGYAAGTAARGLHVFVAGQIGWNAQCRFETDDFVGQFSQALSNVVAVCAAAGAEPRHVTRMTWYITDRRAYLDRLREVGAAWRAIMGRHYPAMAVVQVVALMEERALVEIEADAVIPD